MKKKITFLILFNIYFVFGQFQDLSYQTSFGLSVGYYVKSALLTNGQLLVSGVNTYNTNGYILKLNTNGTPDLIFSSNIGNGFNREPANIKVQNDGKIIVLFSPGSGLTFKGIPVQNVLRLNSNGTYDNSFNFYIAGNQFPATDALIQNDGKILVVSNSSIFRLNSDGTLDNTFNGGYAGNSNDPNASICINILDIKFDLNNKIIVGGCFSFYNNVVARGLIRLNANGTIDSNFITGTGFPTNNNTIYPRVTSIAIESNGKYLIGGLLVTYGGTAVNNVVRLNDNGSLDNTFALASVNFDLVTKIFLQSNGKSIVIGGKNSTINSIPVLLNSIERFLPNGQNDGTFNISTNFSGAFNDTPFVKSLQIQNDGKIIALGTFTTYNNVTVNSIVRLIDQSLSTSEFTFDKQIIYPNPVKDTINISNNENLEFEIYDIIGKTIIKGETNESQINVRTLEKGIYILKINIKGKVTNQKFIKE